MTPAVAVAFGLICLVCFVIYKVFRYKEDIRATKERRQDREQQLLLDQRKDERSRRYTDTLTHIGTGMEAMAEAQKKNNETVERLRTDMVENTASIRLLLATLKGCVPYDISRAIILREVNVLRDAVIHAFQVSLRDNHYQGREGRIKEKMLEQMHSMFFRSLKQLRSYDLAINPSLFFHTDEDSPEPHSPFLVLVWDSMVKFYSDPVDYESPKQAAQRNEDIAKDIARLFRHEVVRGQQQADKIYQVPHGINEGPTDRIPKEDSGLRPSLAMG